MDMPMPFVHSFFMDRREVIYYIIMRKSKSITVPIFEKGICILAVLTALRLPPIPRILLSGARLMEFLTQRYIVYAEYWSMIKK